MPIFARRRIQLMLDELAPLITCEKGNDFVGNLNTDGKGQAIRAEMELALLWALSKLGELEACPAWLGKNVPDAYTEVLFPGRAALVEVPAISDGAMSGRDVMSAASQKLVEEANRIKSGSGKHLYFHYGEESGYRSGRYFRRRKVPASLTVTTAIRGSLAQWLRASPGKGARLRIRTEDLDVVVEWREWVHGRFNYHSSMPPETHSPTENSLYRRLKLKADQLESENFTDLRCVLLGDAGSTLLRKLDDFDPTRRRVTGALIIRHFLSKPRGIDVICVFSPFRRGMWFEKGHLEWKHTVFIRPGIDVDSSGLGRINALLPVPRFEGYQADSLDQQRAFRPERSWYVGPSLSRRNDEVTMKIPARALLDFLAGKITRDLFERHSGLSEKAFKDLLTSGQLPRAVKLEGHGPDKDDDCIVFEFARDPSAAPFQFKKSAG
jgi:hypothetical protein